MIKVEKMGKIIAIIIPSEFNKDGIYFFTPNEYSQQLAYMKRPNGYIISSHKHNFALRQVFNTLETIFIKKGRIRVDLFSDEKEFIESHELKTGDVILLVSGGHGFEMLEETEMIEVKQGPFLGDQDKVRF